MRFAAAIVFGFLALISTGHAQMPAAASTVEIDNGPFAGQPMPGSGVNGRTCAIGNRYAFQITDGQGSLSVFGPLVCGDLKNIGGGFTICELDEDLRCTSKSAAAPGVYSVDENGISHDGETHPWTDRQQAVALFPGITKQIVWLCGSVLITEWGRGKKPPGDREAEDEEACKATLHRLCAAAKGGPVKVASGQDITSLCR